MQGQRFMVAIMAACLVLMFSGVLAESRAVTRGQVGWASWYGKKFQGRQTASGERFSTRELTAAHRKLPLGTKALVTNLETNEQVEVKINDRGPFIEPKRRIIDLSHAAADSLGLVQRGVGKVRVVVSEQALQLQDPTEDVFYEVQVGAFGEMEQAYAVRDQLHDRYPATYVASRNGPLGRYHRVRVGPFLTRQDAQHIANLLKQEGHYVFLDEVAGSAILAQRLQSAVEEDWLDRSQDDVGLESDVAVYPEWGSHT